MRVYRRPTPQSIYTKRIRKQVYLHGAATGTTYFQTITGSITPSGSLSASLVALQSVAGSITPSGSLVKQTQKGLAGAITAVGGLVKQTQRTLSGSITPVGSLVKQAQKTLSGSITPSGALSTVLTLLLTVAGSITGTGTVAGVITAPLVSSVGAAIRRGIQGVLGRSRGR